MVKLYKKYTHRYHHVFHLIIGIVTGLAYSHSLQLNNWRLYCVAGAFASLLPDLEHLAYFFWFGKNSSYSKTIKTHLKKAEFLSAIKHCANNHKTITELPLHNALIPILFFFASTMFHRKLYYFMTIVNINLALHYFYDLAEDLILLKKINSNWFKFILPETTKEWIAKTLL